MKFLEEVEKLQEEYKGYIILVKCGIFFNAVGRDAIILHEMFGLHLICMKEGMCKCGIAVSQIKRFIKMMQENEMSFVICLYDKNKVGHKISPIDVGNNKIIEEDRKCLDCEKCIHKKDIKLQLVENLKSEIVGEKNETRK